jgi:pyridoxamine 5'-phosphate oxidase
MELNKLRKEYRLKSLRRDDLIANPFDQLKKWLTDALQAHLGEPNAMVLATVSKEGRPSTRTVLLKQFDESGLVFHTSLESRKAIEISGNSFVSATFLWQELERQITVEGTAQQAAREQTSAYFAGRPRGSQLASWVSRQGEKIASREVIENALKKLEEVYHNKPVPPPPHWGGFRIIPNRFEFWQGRPNRLHDRFEYTLQGTEWVIQRLSP